MTNTKRLGVALIASTLALSLSACGGPMNHSLYSTAQPVVERTHYTFDLVGGPGGPSIPEQRRLAGWFEALNLKYGDRVSIETDGTDPATVTAVGKIVDRYGLALSEHAPITEGFVEPGRTRVVVTRSVATVPGCPDWSDDYDGNYANATSRNYGCATNSNLAAMVANPEDLVRGQEVEGNAVITKSNSAIEAYRSGSNGTGGSAGTTTTSSPD
ncbi:MAG: pilus assembly protein CpaD [Citromicrobium sp.]|nr:pilus assembly protein CpaD [Citromicrobium sp.]MAO95938.1 pilus assembly protein CpaD [Citromicrobium sp.]MAS85070.1 pilus assembly protein CpaD [Erythrobacteraceae bacterium]MBD75918.1 pilus assembly protein CpaD [Citromicrobium sp.]MBT46207.1 pilus assembly protein CpaD [Citromicrobium sp.]|tara:strand:+ start:271 stop:912 length:642 start_codon:yes stop_codon:yes gene_type:complete